MLQPARPPRRFPARAPEGRSARSPTHRGPRCVCPVRGGCVTKSRDSFSLGCFAVPRALAKRAVPRSGLTTGTQWVGCHHPRL